MHRLPIVIVGVITAGCFVVTYCAANDQATTEEQMRKKLEYSKNILAGLVKEDFGTIIENAKSLNEMAKKRWVDDDSLEYRTQNQVFWFTSGTLILAAKDKNIDSATLSYTQMTLSCVNCHKLLRNQK